MRIRILIPGSVKEINISVLNVQEKRGPDGWSGGGCRSDSAFLPTSCMDSSIDFSTFKAFISMSAAQGSGLGGPLSAVTAAGTTMSSRKNSHRRWWPASATCLRRQTTTEANSCSRTNPISFTSAGKEPGAAAVLSSRRLSLPRSLRLLRSRAASLATSNSGIAATSSSSGGLYPTEEWCNSATGTHISLLFPSPVGGRQ